MQSNHTFTPSLIEAKYIKRYKRFFVDASLPNGDIITAHCANTGSMKGLLNEGASAWFMPQNDPKRKLKFSLEMITAESGSLVGVNTSLPNKLVAEAITAGDIPALTGYANIKREVKYGAEGKSRIDILLTDDNKAPCYVEVKNTTLRTGDAAQFPDAVTTRGAKHLDELMAEVDAGNRAVMFYLVQRDDCAYFSPATDIDPVYSGKLKDAALKGVEVLVYSCTVTPEGITLKTSLEVRI